MPRSLPETELSLQGFRAEDYVLGTVRNNLSLEQSFSEVAIKIADIAVKAVSHQADLHLKLNPGKSNLFKINCDTPDIVLECHYGPLPAVSTGRALFSSGATWSLSRQGDTYVFTLGSPGAPRALAFFDPAFSKGDLYFQTGGRETVSPDAVDPSHTGADFFGFWLDPFEYPLDELIYINFLSQGRGVDFHACGLVDAGRGLLFAGVSQAGKSTTANLWKGSGALLLSDDRIVVRRMDGRLRMYGTPWHGDANIASPESAPLAKLFFLQHATKNYLQALAPIDAVSRLLVRCFPPFYDRNGMDFILKLLTEVAAEIPCYELGFVPDAKVVDFVRGLG